MKHIDLYTSTQYTSQQINCMPSKGFFSTFSSCCMYTTVVYCVYTRMHHVLLSPSIYYSTPYVQCQT